ncbi:MlaE family ABC transporter permease [Verrucomicrobiota bacterium]
MLSKTGGYVLKRWLSVRHVAAVVWGVLSLAPRPNCWPRTVRSLFGRQILFTGIEALGIISLIAFLAGISVVTQTQVWLTRIGQTEMLGSVLVMVIVREVGPILVNLVVAGRSGTAMAAELANMRVRGEINVLDAQGIEPMQYLVMPRVLGMAVSVFCLTIIFIALALGTGFVFGFFLKVTTSDPGLFFNNVMSAISPKDIANVFAKTIIPGLTTGAISCISGLSVRGAVTEVPVAVTRSVVASIVTVLVLSALFSVLTYV